MCFSFLASVFSFTFVLEDHLVVIHPNGPFGFTIPGAEISSPPMNYIIGHVGKCRISKPQSIYFAV